MKRMQAWEVKVIRCRRKTIGIRIDDAGRITVRAPLRTSEAEIRRVLESKRTWIEKTLEKVSARAQVPKLTEGELEDLVKLGRKVIPARTAEWARQVGVTYGRVTVKKQKTLWGSCSAKGNLNFNCLLLRCPEDVMDYVIVHELCHRRELNHSPRFWAEVERILPEYRKPLKWLKTEGQALISRMP